MKINYQSFLKWPSSYLILSSYNPEIDVPSINWSAHVLVVSANALWCFHWSILSSAHFWAYDTFAVFVFCSLLWCRKQWKNSHRPFFMKVSPRGFHPLFKCAVNINSMRKWICTKWIVIVDGMKRWQKVVIRFKRATHTTGHVRRSPCVYSSDGRELLLSACHWPRHVTCT